MIAGDTQSGKSWLAGLLCEQMILKGYTVYAFDPEGDYTSLASRPNTVVLGGGRLLPQFDDLTMLLQQVLSVVLNPSHLGHDEKASHIRPPLAVGGKVPQKTRPGTRGVRFRHSGTDRFDVANAHYVPTLHTFVRSNAIHGVWGMATNYSHFPTR